MSNWKLSRPVAVLILLGVGLTLIGYFSPWVPHRAAGLAQTGFEIGEWIKFVPEVRTGASPLRRSNFYWPPVVAAIGLAMLAAGNRPWTWTNWLLVSLAALLSLFPFPLLEELKGAAGISANLGRFGLIAAGVAAAGLAVWRRQLPARIRGGILFLAAVVGLVLVSATFSAAEPIVEEVYRQLIDPGLGYNLSRSGMALLALVGICLQKRGGALGGRHLLAEQDNA